MRQTKFQAHMPTPGKTNHTTMVSPVTHNGAVRNRPCFFVQARRSAWACLPWAPRKHSPTPRELMLVVIHASRGAHNGRTSCWRRPVSFHFYLGSIRVDIHLKSHKYRTDNTQKTIEIYSRHFVFCCAGFRMITPCTRWHWNSEKLCTHLQCGEANVR